MSSFGRYFKDELLPGLTTFLLLIVACACILGFAYIIPYIQMLPLFRMDTSDASWFTICCAIYFIPFCIVGFLAFICIASVVGAVYFIAVLFYKHVILKPVYAILFIIISLVLLWIGSLGYPTALELVEYLS